MDAEIQRRLAAGCGEVGTERASSRSGRRRKRDIRAGPSSSRSRGWQRAYYVEWLLERHRQGRTGGGDRGGACPLGCRHSGWRGWPLMTLCRMTLCRFRVCQSADPGNPVPLPRQHDPRSLAHCASLTAETVESPLRRDTHGGFGERPEETDPEQSWHRAPGLLIQ